MPIYTELTLTGWIFMLVSVIGVIALTFWCFSRVLNLPPEE